MIWDWDLATGAVNRNAMAAHFGEDAQGAEPTIEWWERNVHPEDRDRAVDTLRSVIKSGGRLFSQSYRFRRQDGSYANVSARGYVIRDENGRATRVVGTVADLSDLHEKQSELDRARAEVLHLSRLSAMGAMGSVIAHELNQPLSAITNYIRAARRLLQQAGEGTGTLTSALEAAEASALRAGTIVRRLRDFVARGRVDLRPHSIDKLVRDACGIALLDAGTLGIQHRLDFAPGEPLVMVDHVQMQQVLVNLLRNAVDAVRDRERREIAMTTTLKAGEVEVCVSDTGCGVPEEARSTLFDPFETSKTTGLGIGLSLSRAIIEAHGGRIWLAEREQVGSRFCFTLPLAAKDEDGLPVK